jgi:ketosteroid isomerase-like protein
MFDAVGGGDVAARTVARWSGRALDPEIAALFTDAPAELLAISGPDDLWAAVVDAEPGPRRSFVDEAAFEEALLHDLGRVAVPSAPWYGPKHGKDGVASFLAAIGDTGPVTEFTPLAYAGNEEGDVMVFIRYAFTATGKHVEMNMHHYWKFRDGKACYVRSSEDTAQVAAALTP